MDKSITITIVALNEEKLIEQTTESVISQLKSSNLSKFEVLLVNDGSTDTTLQLMKNLSIKYPFIKVLDNISNKGIGYSFRAGLNQASFNYYMMLCGDGGLPAENLPIIFDSLGDYDLVIPYMTNLKKIKTPYRYFLSKSYCFILNKLFNLNLKYYNGLSVYPTEKLKLLNIISTGFGFQGEILVKLLKMGCTYTQIGAIGAEKSNRSAAVKISSFINVGKTLMYLIVKVLFSKNKRYHTIK